MQNVRVPFKPRNYALLLVFSIAAFIRFYNLGEKQLWVDEIIQVIHSTPNQIMTLLLGVTEDRGAAPLDYLIQHFFIVAFGPSEVTARLHAAIFGSLTIIAIYFLVRKIFDENVAFLATLLYAVYPLHHHYSQEGRPYALFTLLTVCSYLAFLNVLQKRQMRHWLCYALLLGMLLYTNYYAVFVIFSQFAFLLTLLAPRVRDTVPLQGTVNLKLLIGFASVAVLALICFTPWIVFGIKTIYGFQPAPEVFGWELIPRLVRELSDRSYPLSLLIIALAALGVRALVLGRQFGNLFLLLSWCLLPLPLIFLLLWTEEYFFAIRQILFMTPALYVLVAVGILHSAEIIMKRRQHHRAKAVMFITACIVLISGIVIWLHIPDKNPDLKMAGYFLRQNVQPGDKIVAPNIVGILGYYFPEINEYAADVSALPELTRSIVPGQTIFIVESQYIREQDRAVVRDATADESHLMVPTSDFRGVRVFRLQSQ